MNNLVLKNYFFQSDPRMRMLSLYDFLYKQMLHGQESRMRTRFLNQLYDHYKMVVEKRDKTLEELAERDKDKNIIYLDEQGNDTLDKEKSVKYKISSEVREKFNKDFAEFLNTDYVIEVNASNADMISTIRNIVLNTDEGFQGKMSEIYDAWCIAFENVFAKTPMSTELKAGVAD